MSTLDACSGHGSLVEGKHIHRDILSGRCQEDVVVATALVNMYGKCGSLEDAWGVFSKMPERNMVSWNAMIAAHSQNGSSKDALQLFEQMQQEGIMPNKVTFVSTLELCASGTALAEGKQIHARVVGNFFGLDTVVGTALVNMYGKYGCLSDAYRVYNEMPEHDTITFVSILSVCASCAALMEGKHIHSSIANGQFVSDIAVGTTLINMYGNCGSLEDAQRVFDKMPEQNAISWNAIIAAYAQNGMAKESLFLFDQMECGGVKPDSATYAVVLSACSHAGLLDEGCRCFGAMEQDHKVSPNVDHYNCMIDLFGRMGRLVQAEEFIINMPVAPSIVSWTTFLSACRNQVDVERGEHAACRIFELKPEDTVPYIMLANIYAAAGRVDDATTVISRMRDGIEDGLGQSGCNC